MTDCWSVYRQDRMRWCRPWPELGGRRFWTTLSSSAGKHSPMVPNMHWQSARRVAGAPAQHQHTLSSGSTAADGSPGSKKHRTASFQSIGLATIIGPLTTYLSGPVRHGNAGTYKHTTNIWQKDWQNRMDDCMAGLDKCFPKFQDGPVMTGSMVMTRK